MSKNSKIYVAGHQGLAGSALIRQFQAKGYSNLVVRTHAELELTDAKAVKSFFESEQPEHVILAAAKVGGIYANNTYPADFIYQNLVIQTNVIHQAYLSGVQRLLFLGSSCIYPRDCPQPIREEYLSTGSLETTNRPYALAKIAGIEMCWSYNRQYGTQYLAVMPTNLYGPGDNYDLNSSHVLPALIRKFHDAKSRGDAEVVIWGSGKPKREFLYSDDMAEACITLLRLPESQYNSLLGLENDNQLPPLVNIGVGEDVTILELAHLIAEVLKYEGGLVMDANKPDGTMRKLLNVDRIHALGWKHKTSLREGVAMAYQAYLDTLVAA